MLPFPIVSSVYHIACLCATGTSQAVIRGAPRRVTVHDIYVYISNIICYTTIPKNQTKEDFQQ